MRLRIVALIAVGTVVGGLVPAAWAQHAQFYVLDGFGGVHAGGGAPVISPPTPYFGFDVARDIAYMPVGSAWTFTDGILVLDALGGVHNGGALKTNPPGGPPTPYFGFDAARAIVRRDPSVLYSAAVSSVGVLEASRGAVSATRLSTGKYTVVFIRQVTSCAKVAALGDSPLATINPSIYSGQSGEISTFNSTGANAVAVITRNSSGTLTDKNFHLLIHC